MTGASVVVGGSVVLVGGTVLVVDAIGSTTVAGGSAVHAKRTRAAHASPGIRRRS
ncbi:MAG: hypothetical protein HKO03_11235 [Acidimicrobiia bacterium]|nr:hypothetical protein [Acidimicrobiia bacterium]